MAGLGPPNEKAVLRELGGVKLNGIALEAGTELWSIGRRFWPTSMARHQN